MATLDRKTENAMNFTPVMILHLFSAGAALAIGGAVLVMRKGTPQHRLLGRSWVLLMAATAISSFWIKTSGQFSWIHLLSLLILFMLARAVMFAYQGNIHLHRRWITKAYLGLAVAGVFTLLPERRLGALVWGAFGFI